jgi:uncharacterized protein YqhQ
LSHSSFVAAIAVIRSSFLAEFELEHNQAYLLLMGVHTFGRFSWRCGLSLLLLMMILSLIAQSFFSSVEFVFLLLVCHFLFVFYLNYPLKQIFK